MSFMEFDNEARKEIYASFSNDKIFKDICFAIAVWREEKGFYVPKTIEEHAEMNEKLMLVVTEISEACEAVRHQNIGNFKEEIADTFIRLMDLVGTMEIDIAEEIYKKMLVNEGRPHKHGKVC